MLETSVENDLDYEQEAHQLVKMLLSLKEKSADNKRERTRLIKEAKEPLILAYAWALFYEASISSSNFLGFKEDVGLIEQVNTFLISQFESSVDEEKISFEDYESRLEQELLQGLIDSFSNSSVYVLGVDFVYNLSTFLQRIKEIDKLYSPVPRLIGLYKRILRNDEEDYEELIVESFVKELLKLGAAELAVNIKEEVKKEVFEKMKDHMPLMGFSSFLNILYFSVYLGQTSNVTLDREFSRIFNGYLKTLAQAADVDTTLLNLDFGVKQLENLISNKKMEEKYLTELKDVLLLFNNKGFVFV